MLAKIDLLFNKLHHDNNHEDWKRRKRDVTTCWKKDIKENVKCRRNGRDGNHAIKTALALLSTLKAYAVRRA